MNLAIPQDHITDCRSLHRIKRDGESATDKMAIRELITLKYSARVLVVDRPKFLIRIMLFHGKAPKPAGRLSTFANYAAFPLTPFVYYSVKPSTTSQHLRPRLVRAHAQVSVAMVIDAQALLVEIPEQLQPAFRRHRHADHAGPHFRRRAQHGLRHAVR